MATRASAVLRSPSRFKRAALTATLGVLLSSAACGENGKSEEYPLTIQDGPPPALLDAFKAEGLSDEEATARFDRVMRLSEAYRARQRDPDRRQRDDPDGREFQARAALARLWLSEVFEPNNGPEALPAEAYARDLQRLSMDRTTKVCQVILMPKDLEGEAMTERAQSPDFRDLVREPANDLTALMRTFVTDDQRKKPCDIFKRVASAYAGQNSANLPAGVRMKIEATALEACNEDLFVKPWVDAVCPVETFSTLDPVWTAYGAHVITVLEVIPASTRSEQDLDLLARERATPTWRIERLAKEIGRLGQRFDVGVSRDLSPP